MCKGEAYGLLEGLHTPISIKYWNSFFAARSFPGVSLRGRAKGGAPLVSMTWVTLVVADGRCVIVLNCVMSLNSSNRANALDVLNVLIIDEF